jgi:hypothetical protein
MKRLPNEIVNIIYDYDGRYKENYNKTIKQIDGYNNWFKLKKETIISSMMHYYLLLEKESRNYLKDTQELTFSKFFFENNLK